MHFAVVPKHLKAREGKRRHVVHEGKQEFGGKRQTGQRSKTSLENGFSVNKRVSQLEKS